MPQYKVSFVLDSPFSSPLNVRAQIIASVGKAIEGYATDVQVENIRGVLEYWAVVSEEDFIAITTNNDQEGDRADDLFLMVWDKDDTAIHDNDSGIYVTRNGNPTNQYGDGAFGVSERDRKWAVENFMYADLFNENNEIVTNYQEIYVHRQK